MTYLGSEIKLLVWACYLSKELIWVESENVFS